MTKKIKLFCLPYAGGSAMIYNQWKKSIHPMIQLCPIELAGRGKRFSESFYDSISDAVDDIYGMISDELDDYPYAFFGHSMGALLSYELARKISASSHPKPIHLLLSGKNPPHIMDDSKIYHALPDEEFKRKILKIGGTPPELFEHQELLNIFIPLLRADFRIFETYEFNIDNSLLDCAITLLYGIADEEVSAEQMNEWQRYTRTSCQIHRYEGGHFFINEQVGAVVEMINGILTNTITLLNAGGKTG